MDSSLQLNLAKKTSASTDWSMLPTELWPLITSKIDTAADWANFRIVCTLFRSLLPSPYRSIWFMLPQSRDNLDRPHPPSFAVVLGDQKIHRLSLPEAQEQRCVGSTGTWIVAADLHNNIRLFNPFTREFELNLLPQFTTYIPLYQELGLDYFENLQCDHYVRKIVLSSSDFTSGIVNTECIAVAIRDSFNSLAFARPGDEYWSKVLQGGVNFEDVIFFSDRFFVVNSVGDVLYYKLRDAMGICRISERVSIHFEPIGDTLNFKLPRSRRRLPPTGRKYYLVEWMGELLRVTGYVHFPDINQPKVYETVKFEVHRRDSTNTRWVKLNSLGEYSLFLGGNTSVAVKASDYSGSVKRNCIYFTGDYTGVVIRGRSQRGSAASHDMGVYDMENKTIHSIYSSNISSACSTSIWVIPSTLPTQGR